MVDGLLPPHDLDAEAAMLSAAFIDGAAADLLILECEPTDCYSESHRWMCEAVIELRRASQPVDVLTVCGWLKDHGRLEQVGGRAYLTDVLNSAPVVTNVSVYARRVRGKSKLRKILATAHRILAEGYNEVPDPDAFADRAAQSMHDAAMSRSTKAIEKFGKVARRGFKGISDAASEGRKLMGLPTGIDALDNMSGGMLDGTLTVLAALTGGGKSSLARQQGTFTAKRGTGVMVFSEEMINDELVMSSVCTEGNVDYSRVLTGTLGPSDWPKLTQSTVALDQIPMWLDDEPGIDLLKLRAKLRSAISEAAHTPVDPKKPAGPFVQIKLVIVDYLQLLKGYGDSREQEVASLAQGLKEIAKEFRVAVLALAQFNRGAESRASAKPEIRDLRESGNIGHAADNIWFLWWDAKTQPAKNGVQPVTLTVAKQRKGRRGDVALRFVKTYTRFEEDAAQPNNDAPDEEEWERRYGT